MSIWAMALLSVATVLAAWAIWLQRRDIIPGVGGTMGGEMTCGLIWLVVAVVVAVASVDLFDVYGAVVAFFTVLVLSFGVRRTVARIPKSARG